jgi:hypothetical protein
MKQEHFEAYICSDCDTDFGINLFGCLIKEGTHGITCPVCKGNKLHVYHIATMDKSKDRPTIHSVSEPGNPAGDCHYCQHCIETERNQAVNRVLDNIVNEIKKRSHCCVQHPFDPDNDRIPSLGVDELAEIIDSQRVKK